MSAAACLEQIHRARSSIQTARTLLLRPTPQALEACQPHFEAAQSALASFPQLLGRAPANAPAGAGSEEHPEIRAAVLLLQEELTSLSELLSKAGEFHLGWLQFLALHTQGYNHQGSAHSIAPTSRIQVEG